MKLLYCRRCKDIIALAHQLKSCACGMSKGMFSDTFHAQYTGEFAVPLTILTESLEDAVRNQPTEDTPDRKGGVKIEAFVIPKVCVRMERVA